MSNIIQVSWVDLKDFISRNNAVTRWVVVANEYRVFAFDGPFSAICSIPINDPASDDQTDFETNFKNNSAQSIINIVSTQFEQKDKTLKLCSLVSDEVDSNGECEAVLKVPGIPGSGDGRFISSGMAWFNNQVDGDRVTYVRFQDDDNLLGHGAGFVVGSYTDEELSEENRGWRIPQPRNFVECETLGFYGFAPSGFYIHVGGKSGNGQVSGKKLYVNLEWGKIE